MSALDAEWLHLLVGDWQLLSEWTDEETGQTVRRVLLVVAYRELVDRGVEFAQPPKKESWGTSAIFKDPDGNSFVLGSN